MADMKILLELIADARRFKDGMRQGEQSVTSFAHRAKKEAAEVRNVFNSLRGKLAGMGLSIGTGALLWQSAGLDKSLAQIGQTAGATGQEVTNLRKDLFRLGKDSGQVVDNLKEGFNVLAQSGLNMKEASATLDGINIAMAVTGSEAKTLAGGLTVAAEAFQFDLAKPGKALELLDKMTVAGRLGNAELENLSDIFARVGVNASSAGMNFNSTLAFVEGLSRIERQPERLATLADSTLRVFTNLRYMAEAQKATGIKFFDAKGQRRDAMAVLEDIRNKYKTFNTEQQRAAFVQKAFGKADQDTIKGLRTLLTGNSLDNIRRFTKEISEAGGTLKRDMDAATSNLVDQAGRLKAALREAADGFAAPVKNVLTDLIKWGMDSRDKGGLDLTGKDMAVGGATAIGGTVLLARYGGKLLETLFGKGKKLPVNPVDILKDKAGLAAGIAEGKAVQAATGVTPVYVTNWPKNAGMPPLGSSNTTIPSLPSRPETAVNLAKLATIGKWAGGLGLAGAAGYGVGTLINKGIGAASGKGEGWLGNMLYDFLHKAEKPEVKNDIKLNINIDKNGRVVTESNNPGTNLNISLARGSFGY